VIKSPQRNQSIHVTDGVQWRNLLLLAYWR